jgi:hypothetical protein
MEKNTRGELCGAVATGRDVLPIIRSPAPILKIKSWHFPMPLSRQGGEELCRDGFLFTPRDQLGREKPRRPGREPVVLVDRLVCLPQKELAAKALFGVGCRVINRFTASSSVKAKAG